MRYRIVKITNESDKVEFWVQALCDSLTSGMGNGIEKVSEEFVNVDIDNNPNKKDMIPFNNFNLAKKCLDYILAKEPRVDVVFDTLTSNPPKQTGT